MSQLFEKAANLNEPIECYSFLAEQETFPVLPHWHWYAECIFMQRGTAEITADGQTYHIKKGECFFFPPSSVHAIRADSDALPAFAGMKFDLGKFPSVSSYSPSPARLIRSASESGMPMLFDAAQAEEMHCAQVFPECISENRARQYGYDVMLRTQIYRLLYSMIRIWIEQGLDISSCPLGSEEDTAIENVTEYIDLHLGEALRVADIAAQCHLSYSAFSVKFRTLYGQSCKEYIERMRICKAEEYLLFTDYEISEISRETGFTDSSHFIRSFRKQHGITPGQFRQRRKRI